MALKVAWSDVRDDAATIISDVVYTTMVTVDRRGRPRTRVLIAVWELEGEQPIGWLATYRTRVKAAHIEHNPHVTTSYWSPRQNVAAIESVAAWDDDRGTAQRVWDLYRAGTPRGNGYDPGKYWTSPRDSEFHVLRLEPWRVQVLTASDLAAGKPYRQWESRLPRSSRPADA